MLRSYLAINWRSSAQYRGDYIAQTFGFVSSVAATAVFWASILSLTSFMTEEWSLAEFSVLGVFGVCGCSLFDLTIGLTSLPRKVVAGDIDKYLARPISPLFAVVAEDIQIDEVVRNLITAAMGFVFLRVTFGYRLNVLLLLLAAALMLLGVVALSCYRLLISLLSFWLGDTRPLYNLILIEDFQPERFPIVLLPRWLLVSCTVVLPVGYLATYPTMLFFGKTGLTSFGPLAISLVAWLLVLGVLWRCALSRYESNGG